MRDVAIFLFGVNVGVVIGALAYYGGWRDGLRQLRRSLGHL